MDLVEEEEGAQRRIMRQTAHAFNVQHNPDRALKLIKGDKIPLPSEAELEEAWIEEFGSDPRFGYIFAPKEPTSPAELVQQIAMEVGAPPPSPYGR